MTAGTKLEAEFFHQSPVDCARGLIGCVFEWKGAAGVIVETEAYAAEGDEACHTAFRPTAREFLEKHLAGDTYVYLNYGVHWMFNVAVKGGGGDGFVLIRALEPILGLEAMRGRRGVACAKDLCSGPGKLTQALGIVGGDHGQGFLDHPDTGICQVFRDLPIATTPRVGISREKELPWRFIAVNSPHLSRPVGGKWCG